MRAPPSIILSQHQILRKCSRCTARAQFWYWGGKATAWMLLVAIVAGCTTTGTGFGSTASGASLTTFSWRSSDIVSGTMTATLSDGTTYNGRYYQITPETNVPGIAPLYDGWNPAWEETNSGEGPWIDFNARLAHRAVARLVSPSGSHMRCKFQLMFPPNGMYGGGRGKCQLPDGRTINATFPPV
jgi:hypothetical protein